MNKQKLEKLIENFNTTNFEDFLYDANMRLVDKNFQDLVTEDKFSNVQQIGDLETDDNEKIVVVTALVTEELSERSSRKAQYELAKKVLKSPEFNLIVKAGIFVFYDKQGSFRFSLVFPTYSGTSRSFNSFKRYTYFVSKDQKNKTFLAQIGTADFNSLESIKEAFSVSKVTDDFYASYEVLFEKILISINKDSHFPSFAIEHGLDVEDVAKKLLGQIVFLYFLQRKRWLGAKRDENINQGSLTFFKDLFEKYSVEKLVSKQDEFNFFNDYLEYLFYDALNSKSESSSNFYRPRFDSQIPYLNGGLFEPIDGYDWKNRFLKIPDELFYNGKDGVIDIFDSYNFTIDENSADDMEVSVDPEMLGKVFEKLLSTRNKTGSFYTPRDVVSYMVKQSLKDFLSKKIISNDLVIGELVNSHNLKKPETNLELLQNIDKELKNIKIVDPAVGSGAYPVTILQEIAEIRAYCQSQFTDSPQSIYSLKKQIISENIYGVDIDPGAIDIARLRFWLSLVVDSELHEIEPLPNLDYKMMQGNSLLNNLYINEKPNPLNINLNKSADGRTTQAKLMNIGEVEPVQAGFPEIIAAGSRIADKITRFHRDYYSTQDPHLKKELKKNIDAMEIDFINAAYNDEIELLTSQIKNEVNVKKRKKLEKSLTAVKVELKNWRINKVRNYFPWQLHFVEVFQTGGFDIVIGNPPYVGTKGRLETDKSILKSEHGFADDLYSHFFFQSFNLLKPSGTINFITSKSFWTIQSKLNLRNLLLENNLLEIVDTANPFTDAMVDTCITLVEKNKSNNQLFFKDASQSISNPVEYDIEQSLFENAVNQVIFVPDKLNLKIYHKFNHQIDDLMEKWWEKIRTSGKITQNEDELVSYRNSSKPGDIALLGCLTDGGQGLATGNNGKFVAARAGTKIASRIIETRPGKLKKANIEIKNLKFDDLDYLNLLSEHEIHDLFDSLKEEHGLRVFGKGYLYKIVNDSEIAYVSEMTDDEKLNGIDPSKPHWVPYDKGDREGNRWWLETPYVIDWSIKSVQELKSSSKARWQGDQFYFREGFCWSDIHTVSIKSRLKTSSVFDVKSMSLFSQVDRLPDYYFTCILNSKFISEFDHVFINSTSSFQINDARQIPIIIPTNEQLAEFKVIFDSAFHTKQLQFSGSIDRETAKLKLKVIQASLDDKVYKLYGVNLN